jgi:uncharacterized membrane protein YfcA
MIFIASFLTGILASLGLGGGMVLILYLTIFAHMGQLQAQGINLVFFIPIAVLSLIIHTKNKMVEWKTIPYAVILGVVGAFIGSYFAGRIDSDILPKIFGAFVLIIGFKEIFTKAPGKKINKKIPVLN